MTLVRSLTFLLCALSTVAFAAGRGGGARGGTSAPHGGRAAVAVPHAVGHAGAPRYAAPPRYGSPHYVPRGYPSVGHGALRHEVGVTHANGAFTQRTYVHASGARTDVRYAPRAWGHTSYLAYHHDRGFRPWFWPRVWWSWRPLPWTWPFFGAPWFVAWSWYWSPLYETYSTPGAWITDWVIADMLADAYERGRVEGAPPSTDPGDAPIGEVEREQLRKQATDVARSFQTEQTVDVRDALAQPGYLFAVNESFRVIPSSGATCVLGEGDLLRAESVPQESDSAVTMIVVAAKRESCAAGLRVQMSISFLQEMVNAFAERVDRGLHELERREAPANEPAQP